MAEVKKAMEFESMERQWMRKALETQRQALVRSCSKEFQGSEIYELRQKEIRAVDALLARF